MSGSSLLPVVNRSTTNPQEQLPELNCNTKFLEASKSADWSSEWTYDDLVGQEGSVHNEGVI